MTGAADHGGRPAIDAHEYCRAVEAHLCRQNGGHLIRIVGPAFDLVKGWAEGGIPLAVACAGIDRTIDRAARRPGRRRPMRVEFCDADVLAAFDEWSRAVGSAGIAVGRRPEVSGTSRRSSLSHHVDRVVTQLTALRGSNRVPLALEPALAATVEALDARRAAASSARGSARDVVLTELRALDEALTEAAVAAVSEAEGASVRRDAEAEIVPFRGRLSPAQWDTALTAATARLIRLRLGLPAVAFD
jgi:hypothetical protein